MPPDLTIARLLAESERLASPVEYQREILRVLLALLRVLLALHDRPVAHAAEPVTVATPPKRK